MYPSSTNIVPELQTYFTKFLLTTQLNKSGIPHSVKICNTFLNKNSFIRLLFEDYWPKTSTTYRYLFREETSIGSWPAIIRDRAMIYPASAKYFMSDNDSTAVCNLNVFNLKDNYDLVLLDALLHFRLTDSTSLIVIDSTSVIEPTFTTSGDSTAVLIVNYNTLTRLSKLIFLYLNLEVNEDFSYFDNIVLISLPTEVLEATYEAYVLEKMFRFIADKGR